jgi:hypothetical protein
MSTKNILAALGEANSYVTLATNIGGVLIPIAVGLVKEIKQISTGHETVSYQVLIQTDSAELEAVDKLSKDDLAAINAELAKLGKPPVQGDPGTSSGS